MTLNVLRLKRTDDPSATQHIFLHISQQTNPKTKAKATTKPTLDLKLIATDEEHIYHGSLHDSEVKTLQAANYPSDLETWKRTLRTALLPADPSSPPDASDGADGNEEEGLELVAAIKTSTLTITLRRNIEGITQRLGTLTIHRDDEREELSPFTWLSFSLAQNSALQTALRTLQTAASRHQDQISKLEAQLDEFVRVKKEHEEELVEKFVKLLNAKKGKIRDQQRLLAGAKVKKGVGEVVARGRRGVDSAGAVAGDDDNDEAEADAVDADADLDEDGEAQQETPPRSDTEDEENDLDAPSPPPASVRESSGRSAKRKAAEVVVEMEDENHKPPPRRTLPFADKGGNASARKVAPTAPALDGNNEDDDEDETDDEL